MSGKRIVMVAGEASGDTLGAALIQALKLAVPNAEFSGIGGPKMLAEGFHSLADMDRLSVMGIVDPLKRLPELLAIRKKIKQHCLDVGADVFIGIDSPDFNLNIEAFCKSQGIKTVHYVSPSVWAWRQGRIKGIKQSVDLMLTLLPFEAAFYQQHQVPVKFVGHSLADEIPMNPDMRSARKQLSLHVDKTIVALLPGSRSSEVALLGELFLQTALQIQKQIGDCEFLIPAANAARKTQIFQQISQFPKGLNVHLLDGQSHLAMQAADAVLLASGTTALEAMLLKKPMVVAYKMAPLSFAIISRMVKTQFVSLPNLLAGKMLVPELLQADATVQTLTAAMLPLLTDQQQRNQQIEAFYDLHQQIRCNASVTAANAIVELMT